MVAGKGIAVWIWVVGGVIIGLVMFTILFQLVSFMLSSRDVSITKDSFMQFASIVSRICDMREKSESVQSVSLNNVDFMYETSDQKTMNVSGNRTFGKYLCINMSSEITCVEAGCLIEISTVVNASAEGSKLGGEIGGITGKGQFIKYLFYIEKQSCGVSVLGPGEKSSKHMQDLCEEEEEKITVPVSTQTTTSKTTTTTTTTYPPRAKWPNVVAQFHSDEDIAGGCKKFDTYSKCVNSFLDKPVAGIDGIILSPRPADTELKTLVDKAHSLGITVGMWAEQGENSANGMNEVKRAANLGVDFIEEDERIMCCGMTATLFNSYRTAARQINKNILIGIAEPYTNQIANFLNSGGQPDFISGEWYISPGAATFQWYVSTAQTRGIKVAYWLDGSGVGGNDIDQSCTVYKAGSSVWYFNAAGYVNQIMSSLASCYKK